MEKRLDELIQKFDTFAKHIGEKVARIERGIYGEEENNYPGVIKNQEGLEKRQDKLDARLLRYERRQFKFLTILSVVVVVLQILFETILR